MNFHIHTSHKFNYICILPPTKVNQLQKLLLKIPKVILTGEGSFTKNTEYFTNNLAYIKKLQKTRYNISVKKQHVRSVWIGTFLYSRLVLARSLWLIIDTNKSYLTKELLVAPIGKSFIRHESDIQKRIDELCYGYNQFINKSYIYITPIWQKKYTLYYQSRYYVTIQEFFLYNTTDYLLR